jgi:hypothetical protein
MVARGQIIDQPLLGSSISIGASDVDKKLKFTATLHHAAFLTLFRHETVNPGSTVEKITGTRTS